MLKLFEQVIHVAGTSAEMHAKMLSSSPDNNREPEADCLPPPPVNWSHVVGFIPLVVFTLNKWKTEIIGMAQDTLDTVVVGLMLCSGVIGLELHQTKFLC